MQIQKSGKTHFLYIEQGEKVMESLTNYCKEKGINNGRLSGIGAVRDIEIGAYDLESKSYLKKQFEEEYELISYQGNVTLKDGDPFLHAHVMIGNKELKTRGGHLFECEVAVVGEFILDQIEGSAKRELNPNIGLATWCLE